MNAFDAYRRMLRAKTEKALKKPIFGFSEITGLILQAVLLFFVWRNSHWSVAACVTLLLFYANFIMLYMVGVMKFLVQKEIEEDELA